MANNSDAGIVGDVFMKIYVFDEFVIPAVASPRLGASDCADWFFRNACPCCSKDSGTCNQCG